MIDGMNEQSAAHRAESSALPVLIVALLLLIVIVASGLVGLGFVQFRTREYQMLLDAEQARRAAFAREQQRFQAVSKMPQADDPRDD